MKPRKHAIAANEDKTSPAAIDSEFYEASTQLSVQYGDNGSINLREHRLD